MFLRNTVAICILLRWKADTTHSSETSMILLFYLEDRSKTFLRNVSSDLPSYVMSHIGIQHSCMDFLVVFSADSITPMLSVDLLRFWSIVLHYFAVFKFLCTHLSCCRLIVQPQMKAMKRLPHSAVSSMNEARCRREIVIDPDAIWLLGVVHI